MNETNITTTPTFKNCSRAYEAYLAAHKPNMAQRKELRTQIAALTQQLKDLRAQDKANLDAFLKFQADYRTAKAQAKVAPQA